MLQLDRTALPDTDDLPGSDETPVDNEDQNFVPNILLFVLEYLWRTNQDWFFGVDMAVYYLSAPGEAKPIVPDAFLSLGVQRRLDGSSRKSYFTWKEEVIPQLVLEVVSETKGGEYDRKLALYEQLYVKYYVVYNPTFWKRDRHEPLEIYKLEGDRYQLQQGEPYWMPEIGLGLGRCTQTSDLYEREVLCWFDEKGDRYLTQDERGEAEKQRADAQQKRADLLAAKLRELGIDPDSLSSSG